MAELDQQDIYHRNVEQKISIITLAMKLLQQQAGQVNTRKNGTVVRV